MDRVDDLPREWAALHPEALALACRLEYRERGEREAWSDFLNDAGLRTLWGRYGFVQRVRASAQVIESAMVQFRPEATR